MITPAHITSEIAAARIAEQQAAAHRRGIVRSAVTRRRMVLDPGVNRHTASASASDRPHRLARLLPHHGTR